LKTVSSEDRIVCSGCRNQTYYCSAECQQAHSPIHDLECSILIPLTGIVGFHSVDYSLFRLIIAIICAKEFDRISNDGHISDPMHCQSDMVSHRKSQKPPWLHAIAAASTDIVQEIPKHFSNVSIDDLITLACQINSNSHGIHDPNDFTNSTIGIGMFPLVSLMNHSCIPNALFMGGSYGKFTVKLLKDVDKGSEICVSYVDLWV
jgi:hypothetical protein